MSFYTWIKQNVLARISKTQETITSKSSLRNKSFSQPDFSSVNRFFLDEIDTWKLGDSTKMTEFYTEANINNYPQNFIRQRNCMSYFWAKSVLSQKIKRTTANLVSNITTTLVNIINEPDIYSEDEDYHELLVNILEENDIADLQRKQVTKTLYQGWGAYRIDINTEDNDYPKIRYFDAHNTYFVKEDDDIKAIVYLNHYIYENKEYMLVETRFTRKENGIIYSCIEKKCFLENVNSAREIPLSECEFLKDKQEYVEFPNIPFILGEPCVFYEIDGLVNEGLYGKSIFYGKIDALDDYDQAVSIASTCVRRSMPKVTYPVESISIGTNGMPQTPNDFDTEYIAVANQLTGDGSSMESNTPHVVQPNVDIKCYDTMMEYSLEIILGGIMSLNDIGLNEQTFFRDSAEAIRERSRQTLYTVTYVRKKEQQIMKSLLSKAIFTYKYFYQGVVDSKEDMKNYKINVKYDKFLSPSKEQKIKSYLPLFQSNAISTEEFVRSIYEDEKSDEEMQKEIDLINAKQLMSMQGETFNKTPSFDKNTSPYQDEIAALSDNSGMNNHNRALKGVDEI